MGVVMSTRSVKKRKKGAATPHTPPERAYSRDPLFPLLPPPAALSPWARVHTLLPLLRLVPLPLRAYARISSNSSQTEKVGKWES